MHHSTTRNQPSTQFAPLVRLSYAFVAVAAFALGCAKPTAHRSLAPDAGAQVIAFAGVLDARGEMHPNNAIPRVACIAIEATNDAIDAASRVMLFRGGINDDPGLRDHPRTIAAKTRQIPLSLTEIAGRQCFASDQLTKGEALTIALLDPSLTVATTMIELRVSTQERDGATLVASWPADGAISVPTALMTVAAHFDGDVTTDSQTMTITGSQSGSITAMVDVAPCEEIGWNAGTCLEATLTTPFAPNEVVTVSWPDDLTDGTGAEIAPADLNFMTSTATQTPPFAFKTTDCGIDETRTSAGCYAVDDRGVSLRGEVSAATRAWLSFGDNVSSRVSPYGDYTLRATKSEMSLATAEFSFRALDAAGQSLITATPVSLDSARMTLAITEVCANPFGSEPAQEFVEVLNYGPLPVALAGLHLTDAVAEHGDMFSTNDVLQPHARALLVSAGFNPDNGVDPSVPSGTLIIRGDASLGRHGLPNTGTELYLRDGSEQRLSCAPSIATPTAGTCIVRVSTDPRDCRAEAFALATHATPGTDTDADSIAAAR